MFFRAMCIIFVIFHWGSVIKGSRCNHLAQPCDKLYCCGSSRISAVCTNIYNIDCERVNPGTTRTTISPSPATKDQQLSFMILGAVVVTLVAVFGISILIVLCKLRVRTPSPGANQSERNSDEPMKPGAIRPLPQPQANANHPGEYEQHQQQQQSYQLAPQRFDQSSLFYMNTPNGVLQYPQMSSQMQYSVHQQPFPSAPADSQHLQ